MKPFSLADRSGRPGRSSLGLPVPGRGWCLGFHVRPGKRHTPANRAEKKQRVHEGRTPAQAVCNRSPIRLR